MYTKVNVDTSYQWQYGYIEMRAKLPTTVRCWPAFWMLLADGNPDEDKHQVFFSAHSFNANATDRYSGYDDPETEMLYSYCQSSYIYSPENWHTYSMLWTDKYILGFCDGVEYFYVPNPTPDEEDLATWPFNKEYYLKLNLAIGGWGGTPARNFRQATFEIDQISVYQAQ